MTTCHDVSRVKIDVVEQAS